MTRRATVEPFAEFAVHGRGIPYLCVWRNYATFNRALADSDMEASLLRIWEEGKSLFFFLYSRYSTRQLNVYDDCWIARNEHARASKNCMLGFDPGQYGNGFALSLYERGKCPLRGKFGRTGKCRSRAKLAKQLC